MQYNKSERTFYIGRDTEEPPLTTAAVFASIILFIVAYLILA